MSHAPLLGSVILLAVAGTQPATPAALDLASMPSDSDLAQLLWERSPDMAEARGKLGAAEADRIRAGLFPNPTLDLGANAFAVGTRNPPSLTVAQTPNYTAFLSETLEIAKRGPRTASAEAALSSTALSVVGQLRDRTYDLLERAAEVATSEVRVSELTKLQVDAARLTEIQRQRATHGDTAGMDVDRAALDQAQLESQLGEEQAHLSEALQNCSQTAGVPCQPFGSAAQARAFLDSRLSQPPPADAIAERPDIRSLDAEAVSAREALTLAGRRWIPDPTLHVGYTHDQLIASGNQPNTVGVAVTIPLPFLDHGQGDRHDAQSRLTAAEQSKVARVAQARRDAQSLFARREQVQGRRAQMRGTTLPRAEGLVGRMESALRAGGVALGDLLLARRTYGQLLLDAADLDLSAFRISVGLERAMARGPVPPESLKARTPVTTQESSS